MAWKNPTVRYREAKAEGRLCRRCGWIVKRKAWKKGARLCEDCEYIGVEVAPNFIAHVTKDVQPETLAALAKLAELVAKHYVPGDKQKGEDRGR